MSELITSFDIAAHLETDADIHAFLCETMITGNTSDFIHALNVAARSKGMTEIAKQTGVTRASLYKSLSEGGNPRFDTIAKIVESLGCKLVLSSSIVQSSLHIRPDVLRSGERISRK